MPGACFPAVGDSHGAKAPSRISIEVQILNTNGEIIFLIVHTQKEKHHFCGAFLFAVRESKGGSENMPGACFPAVGDSHGAKAPSRISTEVQILNTNGEKIFLIVHREMLRQIEPERIICYNTPFPEMDGNIVFVDYDRSSWRYMNYERNLPVEDLECYKIGGAFYQNYDIMESYRVGKGGGSAFGGKWKPSKPADYRLVGIPGDVNNSYTRDGELYQTHIGEDGYADMERHNTDHSRDDHSNPHDHEITWEGNHPNWGDHIDYPDGMAPDFESMFGGGKAYMKGKTIYMSPEDNRFQTINDFKWCLKCGGEIQFRWKGQDYGVVRYGLDKKITVYRAHDKTSQRAFDSADGALEYMIGDDRLRDIITQIEVLFRSI